jgi:CxxC motif-containing protein (DUF1111 family)
MRIHSASTKRGLRKLSLAISVALLPIAAGMAATDPGVRPGASAGGPLAGLGNDPNNPGLLQLFDFSKDVFQEVDAVPDGLGPTFNLDSCAGCHSFPAIGGTAPNINPQVALATANGARNTLPSFIGRFGPIREARFVRNPDGTPDGGVHSLFSIAGRADAPACNIPQDNFAQAVASNNVIFRIPTPTFGAGLMEMVSEEDIEANRVRSTNAALGISGKANRNGNDGTITRFGWKAQNKSLEIFSGEAYNVEIGVTNPGFPNERNVGEANRACLFNPLPESPVNFAEPFPDALGDVALFTIFMQFLAPPTPSTTTPGGANSIVQGRNQFVNVGCASCHTPSFTTQPSQVAALSRKPVNLYSDMLVHNMGPGLADRVSQGLAGGDEFRSAPLWGLGQRIFFLHDGRTINLLTAIQAHKSAASGGFPASEANRVVDNFNALSDSDKQAVLNFLRSL